VDLTIVDREAWKTQIRNALSADPPDVVNWYAANRMGPYRRCGPVHGHHRLVGGG
jgi:multiple sugar transport system substrate-binding protein